jgi:hypothetical protein
MRRLHLLPFKDTKKQKVIAEATNSEKQAEG